MVRDGRRAAARARPRSTAGRAARTPRTSTRGSTAAGTAYQSASRPRDHQPAVPGRRDVVGVALQPGGEPERGVVVEQEGAAGDQRAGQRDPADDRRRRRAEPAGVRDRVVAAQPQARGLGAHLVERGPHRPDDEVRLVERRHAAGALARDHDLQPRLPDLAGQPVAEAQRQPERVEARAEVGRGRGDRHHDRAVDEARHDRLSPARPRGRSRRGRRRPRCRRSSPKPSSAVAVSLSPWPVTVTTTVEAGVRLARREVLEQARRCRRPTRARRRRRRARPAGAARRGSGRR